MIACDEFLEGWNEYEWRARLSWARPRAIDAPEAGTLFQRPIKECSRGDMLGRVGKLYYVQER